MILWSLPCVLHQDFAGEDFSCTSARNTGCNPESIFLSCLLLIPQTADKFIWVLPFFTEKLKDHLISDGFDPKLLFSSWRGQHLPIPCLVPSCVHQGDWEEEQKKEKWRKVFLIVEMETFSIVSRAANFFVPVKSFTVDLWNCSFAVQILPSLIFLLRHCWLVSTWILQRVSQSAISVWGGENGFTYLYVMVH